LNIYRQILTKYWGYSDFRPLQEDIILSVGDEKKDTLGLLPTGGGKSIIFQVPALALDGICLVITPLIALMKDQVENLKKRDIKAAAIYSGMTRHEIDITLDNCIFGNFKFLYLSPERLHTEIFLARLPRMKVNLIAIDEAHCISQWGYDFRPSYLKIAAIREYLPNTPFLALTASATTQVVEDIQEKLKFKEKNTFKKSFERKNLVYVVREVEDKLKYLIKIVQSTPGTGVVYVRNRKKTKEIAEFLRKNNITADFYHAGLNETDKDHKQNQWKTGKCRIIVSTNAFGMGIDKPDVRFVVHMDLPDSLEAYFQEAGRGGRDEKKAYAVLLYHVSDKIQIEHNFESSFPEIKTIKNIYHALGNYFQLPIGSGKEQTFDFRIDDFATKYNFPVVVVYNALKFLQTEGYLEMTDPINSPSKIFITIDRDDLYKFQVANPKFDSFLKLILRNTAGVFSDYSTISERALAKQTNSSEDIIVQYLKKLDQLGIINYIPQKNTPYIFYTEERLDEKSLIISKEYYDKRKKTAYERMINVLLYAESSTKCRSQILLNYFGEKNAERCGQCDVCKKRNELDLSRFEFDLILEQIKNALRKNIMTVEELVDIQKIEHEKVLKVIKWLLENEKIAYTDDKKLKWHD